MQFLKNSFSKKSLLTLGKIFDCALGLCNGYLLFKDVFPNPELCDLTFLPSFQPQFILCCQDFTGYPISDTDPWTDPLMELPKTDPISLLSVLLTWSFVPSLLCLTGIFVLSLGLGVFKSP